MPDKKLVSLKSMEPRRIMDTSLKMSFEQFKIKNPTCHVSFSKFAALRPKSVKTMKNNFFNNCLCEYCSNIVLKASCLNKTIQGQRGKLNKYKLLKKTLCSKDEGEIFFKKECIDRTCSRCGVQQVNSEMLDILGTERSITWKRWESQTYTDKSGKKTSRKMLRLKDHNVKTFLDELCEELTNFSSHLHNARWQHNQFTSLIHDVPQNWVVFCMDYSENYTCLYQDEAQSAHWSHEQATLFSIVAYYRCKNCSEIVTESLLFVSDDKKHDCHGVHHFVTVANDHLIKSRNITVEHEIHFSDGAASQFKSKTPFADVANSSTDFGFPCEKHFFGSRHGKGPCDGEFGVVKRTVSQGVVARKALVRNAEEFYLFAKEKLTKEGCSCLNHKLRTFFFVNESDVCRDRKNRINSKPVPETRKLHAVKPCNEGTSGVATRALSCFCPYCTGLSTESSCESSSHVCDWSNGSKPKSGKITRTKSKLKNDDGVKKTKKKRKRVTSRKKKGNTAKSKKKGKMVNSPKKSYTEVTVSNEVIGNQSRSDYFREVLTGLQSSETFKELQTKCKAVMIDQRFKDFQISIDNNINMIDNGLLADRVALDMVPREKLPEDCRNSLPVTITGDGNCLPRSISVACFGHERIAVEMCTNVSTYCDNEYLNKGVQLPEKEAVCLAQSFAMFFEEYTPGDRLTKTVIQRLFEAEALKVVEDKTFMGIWQLFCAASVVGVTLRSIYPNLGDRLPKLLLNRTILPRKYRTYQSEMVIMWTSNRDYLQERNWIPNHFVPIVPQCRETDEPTLFADSNDSTNDALIEDILHYLFNADTEDLASATGVAASDEIDVIASADRGLTPTEETDQQSNVSPVVLDATVSGQIGLTAKESDVNGSAEKGLTPDMKTDLQPNVSPVVLDATVSGQIGLTAKESDVNGSAETGLTPDMKTDLQPNVSPVVLDATVSGQIGLTAKESDVNRSAETGLTPDMKTDIQPNVSPVVLDATVSGQIGLKTKESDVNRSAETGLTPDIKTDIQPNVSPVVLDATVSGQIGLTAKESDVNGSAETGLTPDLKTDIQPNVSPVVLDATVSGQIGLTAKESDVNRSAETGLTPDIKTDIQPNVSPVVLDATVSGQIGLTAKESDVNGSAETGLTPDMKTDIQPNVSPVVSDATLSGQIGLTAEESDVNRSAETGLTPDMKTDIQPNVSPVVLDATVSGQIGLTAKESDVNRSAETGLTPDMKTDIQPNVSPVVLDATVSGQIGLTAKESDVNRSAETGLTPKMRTDIQPKYQPGLFIVVSHGTTLLPAVVDKWPWIRFCKKAKRRMWTINEVQHTIVEEDVVKIIDAPDVVMCGTRLLYKFADL